MIKKFKIGQEKQIESLITSVFDDFVGHEYSELGNKTFNDFINPKKILSRYSQGNIILVYEENKKIIGVIEVRDDNHICLFFVDKEHHNKGIGKKLLHAVVKKIQGKTNFIETNASPFSEKIYAKLGFQKTGELTEKNGIKFIPMKKVI